ncbi:MAG TPA: cytochrome c [Bryobacteraceae bacterium]|jgi:cytochrome c|nr:cytochrome c [Bryobacteraceae bacterium]
MKKSFIAIGCFVALLAIGQDKKGAAGDATKGKDVFEENCSVCHNADSTEKKMGPGLKGLFKKDKLNNGKKPTEANIKALINAGGNGMPPYADMLTDEEKANVIAYLKTL